MKLCVDASALLAIYLEEPDALEIARRIALSPIRVMSPVNYWEALVRARSLHQSFGVEKLDRLIASLSISITTISADHARLAATASATFGKPHKARLNLGDCFAYALAVSEQAPLVFKGNDFSLTDVPR